MIFKLLPLKMKDIKVKGTAQVVFDFGYSFKLVPEYPTAALSSH